MRKDIQKLIEIDERMFRESWELRKQARRVIEDSKAIGDRIPEEIRLSKKMLKKFEEKQSKSEPQK